MAVALPVLLLLLFGYALTLDVDNVPLHVWDQSRSPESRELVARFDGSRYFSLRGYASGYPELERAIDRREALAALVIPEDFGSRAASGRPAAVQLLLDGSDSNTATIAAGYAEAVVRAHSERVTLRRIQRAGAPSVPPPVDVRARVWFNTDMESKNFIVPGLIAVVIMVIAALLTSLTVAREWERGTMEQLISTPVKGSELIVGKLLPYFGLGMADIALAVAMGQFLFRIPLRGSLVLLFGLSAVFLVGALSLGLFISVAAKSQLLANQMAILTTFLPTFLLSGFIYSIRNMPKPVQVITHLIPARYFISLLRGIYLKGVGLTVLAGEALLLAAFGALMLTLAIRKFRKKLG
jgi:ABC-2 type transport system permease protein